jgi:death-on-curing protein
VRPQFLTLDDVLSIHAQGLKDFGGAPGVRDMAALESAAFMPQAGFGEDYLHKGVLEMAAAYLYHLCQGHAFVDGNKRVAVGCAHVFLNLNGRDLTATNKELTALVIGVASGKMDKSVAAKFLAKHSKPWKP